MNVRDIAIAIQNWAKSNGMMGESTSGVDYDSDVIQSVFKPTGVSHSISVFQEKQISYIGVDEKSHKILIYTKKKLSIKDLERFNYSSFSLNSVRYHLEIGQSSVALAGGPPSAPPGIAPYYMHGGRFTCGGSIYIGSERGAGTLGCLVRGKDGNLYGLSNNHVTGASNYAVPGLPIVAPGILDVAAGGQDPETIGHHAQIYPFIDGLPDVVDASGNIDAAIFRIAKHDRISSMQRNHYDTPSSVKPLAVGQRVTKVGRTSNLTEGVVKAELVGFQNVFYSVDSTGLKKVVYFASLFTIASIRPDSLFAYPGDSGSIIVYEDQNKSKHAVGLLVAGTPEGLTLALSLDRITDYFDVELVSNHNI